MIQELVRVLAPLEVDAVLAVVQFLASSVSPGVVTLLHRLPSLLPVFESFPRCPPNVALHHHCGSPARSLEEHEVEVGVVAHPLGQIVAASPGRLLLPLEGISGIRGGHAEYCLQFVVKSMNSCLPFMSKRGRPLPIIVTWLGSSICQSLFTLFLFFFCSRRIMRVSIKIRLNW